MSPDKKEYLKQFQSQRKIDEWNNSGSLTNPLSAIQAMRLQTDPNSMIFQQDLTGSTEKGLISSAGPAQRKQTRFK